MDITPENILSAEHKAWLVHPVTIQLLKNIEKHKKSFVDSLSFSAGNNDLSDSHFRNLSYGLKTIDVILSITKETTKFVQLSEK